MKATATKSVQDVSSLVDEIRTDLGGGATGYTEYAEFKGKVSCDTPVVGELSGQQAAIAHNWVIREYETRTEQTDSEGNVTTHWKRSSERLSDNRQEAPFFLEDSTGRVKVLPRGADMTLKRVIERFEEPSAVEHGGGGGFALTLGSFSLSTSGYSGSDRRTLGYRFIEEILPLGSDLYALGEIADTEDGLALRKPEGESKKPFLLSLKSEAELVRSTESAAKWKRIIGLGLIIGGIVASIVHFI